MKSQSPAQVASQASQRRKFRPTPVNHTESGGPVHSSQEISAKSGTEHAINPALSTVAGNLAPGNASSSEYRILRRNGSVVGFEQIGRAHV